MILGNQIHSELRNPSLATFDYINFQLRDSHPVAMQDIIGRPRAPVDRFRSSIKH